MARAKPMHLTPLPTFSPEEASDVAQKWSDWRESFEYFIVGSGVTEDAQKNCFTKQVWRYKVFLGP